MGVVCGCEVHSGTGEGVWLVMMSVPGLWWPLQTMASHSFFDRFTLIYTISGS